MFKRLLAALASLILGVAGVVALATPAHAAASWIRICNHSNSVDAINVYNRDAGVDTVVYAGTCWDVTDLNGATRVDVDVASHLGDVDSWKKNKDGGSYGPCYNNEDESSNPYSDYTGVTTKYYTYSHTGC